jgi:protein gp37
MGKTAIEWTDLTLNPIRARHRETGAVGWHCEHANPDCINCYAEGINRRLGTGLPFKPGHLKDVEIFLDESMLRAALPGLRRKPQQRVFITSMTDAAGRWVTDDMLDGIFGFTYLATQACRAQVQILTKRPTLLAAYLGQDAIDLRRRHQHRAEQLNGDDHPATCTRVRPYPGVWLGFSAGTQDHFDAMWAEMRPLAQQGWNIFVSLEPLHAPIVLPDDFLSLRDRAWVIVGGESKGQPASKPRPTHPAWVRALQRQCAIAGVLFFFKQWGHWLMVYDRERDDPDWRLCDAVMRDTPKGQWLNNTGGQGFHGLQVVRMSPVGKKAAGAQLDGRLFQQLPPFTRAEDMP